MARIGAAWFQTDELRRHGDELRHGPGLDPGDRDELRWRVEGRLRDVVAADELAGLPTPELLCLHAADRSARGPQVELERRAARTPAEIEDEDGDVPIVAAVAILRRVIDRARFDEVELEALRPAIELAHGLTDRDRAELNARIHHHLRLISEGPVEWAPAGTFRPILSEPAAIVPPAR